MRKDIILSLQFGHHLSCILVLMTSSQDFNFFHILVLYLLYKAFEELLLLNKQLFRVLGSIIFALGVRLVNLYLKVLNLPLEGADLGFVFFLLYLVVVKFMLRLLSE